MEKTYKKIKLYRTEFLGGAFILVWAIDFLAKASMHGLDKFQFMFFSSIMVLFGGIGLLLNNKTIVASVFAISLIELWWSFDMAALVFIGKPVLHAVGYLNTLPKIEYFIALRHLFVIPGLLYGLSQMKGAVNKADSIMTTLAIYLFCIEVPFFFAPSVENINFTNLRNFPFSTAGATSPDLLKFLLYLLVTGAILAGLSYIVAKIPRQHKYQRILSGLSFYLSLFGILLSLIGYFKFY